MADCSGNWIDSTITWEIKGGQHVPPEEQKKEKDGSFNIKPHGGSSSFSGKHKDIKGKERNLDATSCTDTANGKFDITFRRVFDEVSGERLEYTGTGEIIDSATGRARITGRVKVKGGPDPGDTGTWETTRPGGGDGDEKDKDKDKDRPEQRRDN